VAFVTFYSFEPSYYRNEQGFPIGFGRSLRAAWRPSDCLASGTLARTTMQYKGA
jgi:hypothetical protein